MHDARPTPPPRQDIEIRDAVAADWPAIVALNAAVEHHTSPMDLARVRLLHGLASRHRVAAVSGRVAGFLLAMREATPYRNDNYAWFASRYTRFVYVDRIVVAGGYTGRRIGSTLYADLFAAARSDGIPFIVCEYDLEPPNPASMAFHAGWGFREVGRQRVADGRKLVSLQAAEL